MSKFIYCFTKEDYEKLLKEGYEFICECNMGKKAYVFENNPKSLNFDSEDKKTLLFDDTMYF